MGGRERERKRDRDRQTETEIHTQRHRHRDRDRDRQIDRHRQGETGIGISGSILLCRNQEGEFSRDVQESERFSMLESVVGGGWGWGGRRERDGGEGGETGIGIGWAILSSWNPGEEFSCWQWKGILSRAGARGRISPQKGDILALASAAGRVYSMLG